MGTIVLIVFVLLIIGLIVWFLIANRKPDSKPDVPKPAEPDTPAPDIPGIPDVPETPDTPDVPEEPEVEPEPQPSGDVTFDLYFKTLIEHFHDVVDVESDMSTYKYIKELVREAKTQYADNTSCYGLPLLYKQENFPQVYDYYGDKGSEEDALNSLCGWVVAMQLAELRPYDKTRIFRIAYTLAYNKYDDVYGYKFRTDPNIARIVGSAIYAAMRGLIKPDIETMRKEVGGTKYNDTLEELGEGDTDDVSDLSFFIDFREFMPTAPGPYAPEYRKRPDNTYPYEARDDYNNLKVDRQIHEMIVEAYNLDSIEHFQDVVQAIADKESDVKHLFGPDRKTEHYHFHPVFGKETIGVELPYDGIMADSAWTSIVASSSSRCILQSRTVTPVQYGRLRPGCSWEQEAHKNSDTDDRRNILTNFEIEDGDGSPTGYYDENNKWVYRSGIGSPEEFEENAKNSLWANSYPSGHSAGIMGAALFLIELMPYRSDRILKAANQYAINRTITRFHWTSDTINGRVIGGAANAISHAASDYDDMLNASRKELEI